jgi:hypothetical protein
MHTKNGLRALDKDKPANPASVEKYLVGKFGSHFEVAIEAMHGLARSRTPSQLAAEGFALYVQFRPRVPEDETGWGAKGALDLDVIAALAESRKPKR